MLRTTVGAALSEEQVRRLFALDGHLLFMDAGILGSPLRSVADRDAVCSTFAEVRQAVAPGFGCDADEIVITNSTTDSLGRILAGLELAAGDEILTTNHEHYGALAPLALARDRRSVGIRRVPLPVGNRQRAEDYLERFAAAITGRTRALLFSAPTATTGTMLPIRMLTRLAQDHGLVSIVDAAHLPGMLHCSFHELGADFLAGSGTKWQCGPAGTGILYVRNKVLPEHNPRPLPAFWPVLSIWYPLEGGLPPRSTTREPAYDVAEYLQTAGSASRTRMLAFQEACETWDRIGRTRIERHLQELSAYLKERLAERWGEDSLYSPMADDRLTTAISSFNPFRNPDDALDERKFATFVERLEKEHGIVVRSTRFEIAGSSAPHHAVRISTRLVHGQDDVDRLVRAMAELSDRMA